MAPACCRAIACPTLADLDHPHVASEPRRRWSRPASRRREKCPREFDLVRTLRFDSFGRRPSSVPLRSDQRTEAWNCEKPIIEMIFCTLVSMPSKIEGCRINMRDGDDDRPMHEPESKTHKLILRAVKPFHYPVAGVNFCVVDIKEVTDAARRSFRDYSRRSRAGDCIFFKEVFGWEIRKWEGPMD